LMGGRSSTVGKSLLDHAIQERDLGVRKKTAEGKVRKGDRLHEEKITS